MDKRSSFPIESIIKISFISLCLGVLQFISPGIVFCFFLTMISFYVMLSNIDAEDKQFIAFITCAALSLRIIFLILSEYYILNKVLADIGWFNPWDLYGDGSMNIHSGLRIADYLNGKTLSTYSFKEIFVGGNYNVTGIIFFNGFFFSLFGNVVFPIRYLNSLIIVVSGGLLYSWTKSIHSAYAGKIAISLFLFWPTILIWSITDLKESQVISSLILILWCLNKIIAANNIKRYFILFCVWLLIAVSIYLIGLRPNLYKMLLPAFFSIISVYYFFVCFQKERSWKIYFFINLIIISLTLIIFRQEIFQIVRVSYDSLLTHHRGFLTSGGVNYNLFGSAQEYYSLPFILFYWVNAWFHFMLEPFPWRLISLGMLANFPQMLVWYGLIVMSRLGIMTLIKAGKSKEIFPLVVFLILYVTIVGMASANIGTAVRFRDTITPIVIMLAACGIASLVKKSVDDMP